jgi:hypothetical protein
MIKSERLLSIYSLAFLLALVVSGMAAQGQNTDALKLGCYPVGKMFPLGVYALDTPGQMQAARVNGWNIAHTYQTRLLSQIPQEAASGGMLALANLPGKETPIPEAVAARTIQAFAQSDRVVWWNLPEERRWWVPNEMALITNYAQWTRKYDPKKRPNMMYIPGHYSVESVQKYVPYLDIIPASVYTTYQNMPHAWARWRVESTLEAIRKAGKKIGPDYLNGEKIPIAILELYHLPDEKQMMTPEGAYHDFWQSIVCGARGILVYSYAYRNASPSLAASWQQYQNAAAQVSGPERIGEMLLNGKDTRAISWTVLSGPKQTKTFTPAGANSPISYPSINLLQKTWNDAFYLIAVNSAEEKVTVQFSGCPANVERAAFPFENRDAPIQDRKFEVEFAPLGVHIIVLRGKDTNHG